MNQDHCLVEQFEMIFRAHFSSVKFFINMFLKSEADAEDLAQDVFTKLWTNFETWQNNDGKEGYIYAMAKNVAFDFIKHKRLENDYREEQIKKSTIKDLLGFSDPLNSLYYKEMQLIIRMALENFPERRRRIFEMSRFNNMSNLQSPNQKIPDRKTKCVIKTHINIKQNVIFGAKLKPV